MPEDLVLVKDIMSKPALIVGHSKSARAAAVEMRKARKGFLVVVKKGNPIGVLSDTDLINKIIVKKKDASKVKVSEIMSTPFISISPEDDSTAAVNKMKKSGIHRLPVVNNGKVVGVISLTDIARMSPDMHYLLEYRQEMKRHPIEIKEKFTSGICDSCGNYSEHLDQNIEGQWVCESCLDEMEEE